MSTDLLLAPVAETVVTNLIAVASEQLHFAFGWKGDLEKFCSTMEILRGVLQDAEERNLICGRLALKRWIEKLRAVADEAEDVMEEVAYENLRRLVVDSKPKWKKLHLCLPLVLFLKPLVFHLRIGNKVKNLNSSLLEINASAAQFGLQYERASAPSVPLPQPPPTDYFPPPQFVGRDEDVLKIESLLVESTSQQDLPVTVIVGMPGLGKTTLAKAVLISNKIRQKFGENVIWVCVSKSFDPELILKEILASLGGGDGVNESSQQILMTKIQQKLDGKHYLLILDDVWNQEVQKWKGLRDCLLGINGFKVLVTTRIEKAASVMAHSEEHICRLKKLEDDECWSIIKQEVFGSSSMPSEFGELEAVGEKISRKCKGVPLVASLIGATLKSRRGKREWESMLKNRVWQSLEKENGISDIIKFSYDRLPGHALKQCFAFCSIFPEDYIMEKDVLIQLWMAQGFLQPYEGSSAVMEDVGDEYFRHLLSYSLFQEDERDDLGRVISCTMHDLIHDFAKSLSGSESVVLKEEPEKNISNQTRHLNLIPGGEVMPTVSRDGAPKLRTLLFSEQDTCDGVQLDSERLRVLHVSRASDAKQLSKCFGKSKSLRYLDISGTNVKEFPKFIKKLYHLQTFRLMDCWSLQMPPEGLGDLINLSHIYFSDEDRMPANLGKLTDLQTLKEFYVGKTKGRRIEELGSLRKLRGRLVVYNLERVEGKSEAESARLREKALDELGLYWVWSRSEDSNDEGVLEGLLPHSSLQKLALEGFGGTCLPSWMLNSGDNRFQFNSLVVLKFESCKKLKSIPAMEGFSSLKELSIEYCEELSDGAFTFQSLKKLSIRECRNVESLSFSGLTSLEELQISRCGVVNITGDGLSSCTHLRILKLSYCRKLKNVPNLHGLSSLREVDIYECGELECLPSGWSSCTALVKLAIWSCPKLSRFPEEMLGCLSKLKRLKIGGFSNEELEEFPGLSSINNLSASVEDLTLIGWEKLTEVPSEIQALTALKELEISGFDGVEALPEWLGEFSSLKSLSIASCSGLKSLERGLPSCTSLEKLSIWKCDNLVSLPVELKELRSLVKLSITRCPKLRSFPEEILGGLTRLKRLVMGPFCEDLEEFIGLSSIYHLHSSLEQLTLWGWGEKLAELPQQIQHLTALRTLDIWSFEGMEALPDWLAENLPSLQSLQISSCPKLKTLPSAQLIKRLSKLNLLDIYNPEWPELKEKIEQEKQSANQNQ